MYIRLELDESTNKHPYIGARHKIYTKETVVT